MEEIDLNKEASTLDSKHENIETEPSNGTKSNRNSKLSGILGFEEKKSEREEVLTIIKTSPEVAETEICATNNEVEDVIKVTEIETSSNTCRSRHLTKYLIVMAYAW